jgi:hypothetical protein
VTNAGTFAVQDSEKLADNAGFTDGTTKVNPVGFIFDEVAGTALTENDVGAGRMEAKRAQVLVVRGCDYSWSACCGFCCRRGEGRCERDDAAGVGDGVDTANSAVNVAQVAGTTTDTNSGVKSAGTQRVVLATDQPQLTNALKVDGSAVTQPVSGCRRLPDGGRVRDADAVDDGRLVEDHGAGADHDQEGGQGVGGHVRRLLRLQPERGGDVHPGLRRGVRVGDAGHDGARHGVLHPGNASGGAAANLEFTNGVNMATAITLACTTTATGSTAPSTGLDLTLFFK